MRELARVQCNCTDHMLNMIQALVKKFSKSNIKEIMLRINEGEFPKSKWPVEEWPLRIVVRDNYSRNGGCFYVIGGIMSGYNGQGPKGTIEAIKKMGFDLSPEEEKMITSKKTIFLLLKK